MSVAPKVEQPRILYFPVLLYRERTGEESSWFARSVLSCDLAPGKSPEAALETLGGGMEARLQASLAGGMSVLDWSNKQVPDDPSWIQKYLSAAWEAPPTRRSITTCDGVHIEAMVVRSGSA